MRTAIVLNTLRLWQNGRYFAECNFKRIFLNDNYFILIQIPLKFVLNGSISNNLSLVQIMAWRRRDAKPLSAPIMVYFTDAYKRTRPQWVKIMCGSSWPWLMLLALWYIRPAIGHSLHYLRYIYIFGLKLDVDFALMVKPNFSQLVCSK